MNNTYDNYAYYRDLKHFTDFKVSTLAGLSKSTISDWKLGKHYPRTKTLKKIADILGIDVNAFYNSVPGKHSQPLDKAEYMPELQKAVEESPYKFDNYISAVHDKVIEYNIKMADGTSVFLNPQEYKELQEAVAIYIDTWVRSKKKIV